MRGGGRAEAVLTLLGAAARVVRLRLNQRDRSMASRRMAGLANALGDRDSPDAPGLAAAELLQAGGLQAAWLVHAAVRGELPRASEVLHTARRVALDGGAAGLADVLSMPSGRRPVRFVRGVVLVDLEHTAATDLATGIQRVAREAARRWDRDHDVLLVGWTDDHRALRALSTAERHRALGLLGPAGPSDRETGPVVVPLDGTYVLPELAVERRRTERIGALAAYSGLTTSVIGFDCVPLTSAETTDPAMGGAFAANLAAVREMDAVAAISDGAAQEYEGWAAMLEGTGSTGPAVTSVSLPTEARAPVVGSDLRLAELLGVGTAPLVLCVGSHEPRKNHATVLHAAELAWRDGLEFTLLMVGGNAWRSERFTSRLAELTAAGRPVRSVQAVDDDLLWAAYRAARFLVFPSLSEGFGLPVAEALACGTPVLTTRYGSTAQIAEGGGALLVDPRDDDDVARGLVRLLTDDDLCAELSAQARARPGRTWDDYAAEAWQVLVDSPADHPVASARLPPHGYCG